MATYIQVYSLSDGTFDIGSNYAIHVNPKTVKWFLATKPKATPVAFVKTCWKARTWLYYDDAVAQQSMLAAQGITTSIVQLSIKIE